MVIFRCTQKLAKRFNLHLEKDFAETSTNVLGDWYFNYFTHQRKYYLLGLSENSLLPVVIQAKEIKDFPLRFHGELGKILEIIGIDQQKTDEEISEMQQIRFAKTKSKKVLGSQNDCIRLIPHILENAPCFNVSELAMTLGKMPFKSINYLYPYEMTVKCFDKSHI
jgi:hypothetical protein